MSKSKAPRYITDLLGHSHEKLWRLANHVQDYYYEVPIPKLEPDWTHVHKNGIPQFRITTPSRGKLRFVQERIKRYFLQGKPLPATVHGGVKLWSPAKHAEWHLGKKFHFVTDIKGYYPSVTPPMVYDTFRTLGHEAPAASLLTKLTTVDYLLPQGTVTSPYLANLVFAPIDRRIEDLCKKHKITYSRWVDDLAFSASSDFQDLIPQILACIQQQFRIAHRKTGYKIGPTKMVGVIVHNNILKVPKEKLAVLEHAEHERHRLESLASYILSVNPSCTTALSFFTSSPD